MATSGGLTGSGTCPSSAAAPSACQPPPQISLENKVANADHAQMVADHVVLGRLATSHHLSHIRSDVTLTLEQITTIC